MRIPWTLKELTLLAHLRGQGKTFSTIRDSNFPDRTYASVRSASSTDRYKEVAEAVKDRPDVFMAPSPERKPPTEIRILGIDIETSPNTAYVWGLFKQTVSLSQLIESSRVMCFAAKWFGMDCAPMFYSERNGKHEGMILQAWSLLDEADAVVHYFGSRFDVPTLNKEFLKLGLAPPSPYAQIDLIKTARSQFKFTSNKLEHILDELGMSGKLSNRGFKLWVDCMYGDDDAWREMEEYNVQDVAGMEPLYQKLLPWIKNHPNIALFKSGYEKVCPKCGSEQIEKRGFQRTKVAVYQRYQCKECASWSQSRFMNDFVRTNVLKSVA
jgi:predicted RNA-binding Zn-ribbon protein involved in translation (DUF1610 family)